MIKMYGIKNCDSVKKAVKYLKDHNLEYEFIDFKETPVSNLEISKWLEHSDIKTLFNTRGTTYRTLKLGKLDLDETQKQEWLAKENMLIKRPVIVLDNDVIVGYNETLYQDKLN